MRYKIVIVNYTQQSSDVSIITEDNKYIHRDLLTMNFIPWKALKIYGVHIFECDDLESFDLLKAQKEKDEPDSITEFLESPATKKMWAEQRVRERKTEIKRIAERHYIDNGVELSIAIEMAMQFVDHFDFEFDRLEKQDDKS